MSIDGRWEDGGVVDFPMWFRGGQLGDPVVGDGSDDVAGAGQELGAFRVPDVEEGAEPLFGCLESEAQVRSPPLRCSPAWRDFILFTGREREEYIAISGRLSR